MKFKYKYIHFVYDDESATCTCYSNSRPTMPLGDILWYTPWHKYVFNPVDGCVFDESCLLDIADFLRQSKEADHERVPHG